MTRTADRTAAVLLLTALVLSACGAPGTDAPGALATTSPAATAPPAPVAPDPAPVPSADLLPVPVRSAGLSADPAPEVTPPVRLTVTSLGIDIPVDPVGVQPDGQMEIPPRADRAGWYRYGAAPTDALGTTVIAAHVDSVASKGLGPFARLRDLEVGATVTAALANGTSAAFTVEEVRTVPKTDVAWGQIFVRDGAPRLVLVTCGGSWQPAERHYSDNVIVVATPVR